MSGTLKIRSGPGMPPTTIEVVSPDLETVGRVWLDAGQSTAVEVPSEGSFLRVYLPSGEIVTLKDPGKLDREVSLSDLMSKSRRRPRKTTRGDERVSLGVADYERLEAHGADAPAEIATPKPRLAGDVELLLSTMNNEAVPGSVSSDGATATYRDIHSMEPAELQLHTPDGRFCVRLPGQLERLLLRSVALDDGLRLVSVGVRTTNRQADTLGGFGARGDYHSAGAMADWADRAEEMLYSKMADPFGAVVGAYLLLRLRRFDQMRTWARNLADSWPAIPDGSIIWAWQLIHQRGAEAEINKYLQRAAGGELPVFTEGLKLLVDGLGLLGKTGAELQKKVSEQAGVVLWDSPFTAFRGGRAASGDVRVKLEVGYAEAVEGL